MDANDKRRAVFVVDPISYSGMAYYDAAQVSALRSLGVNATLLGSDKWMLDPTIVPRIAIFRDTTGPQWRFRRGAAYIVGLARLLRLVHKVRPLAVHWQYTELPMADLLAILAIRLLGIRQVYTAHEIVPWTSRRYDRLALRAIYVSVNAIVVHDRAQRAEIAHRFRVRASRVHVAQHGDFRLFARPDLPQSEARIRVGVGERCPIALFFGSIHKSKGLDVLLDAWPYVLERVPDAILLIVGKPVDIDVGPIMARLGVLAVGSTVRTRFEHVTPAEANDYYRAADVIVLPNHDIGTSGVLRYAYSSARPVVASSVGEHRSTVVAGVTGHLVPPADPARLATALIDALRDRPNLAAMGEAAKDYATARFDWMDSGRVLVGVYETLM